MALLDAVRRTIRRQALASPTTRVVAAVSGGPDSVALLYLLREFSGAGELTLAGVAHFNHQLRPAADTDEHYCEDLAARLDLPFVSDRADVAALAKSARRSMEDAARTARHAFYQRAAERLGADVVALGHTRDDQAETFLLRLLRGAGARGLASMHPRTGIVIRPVLDCRRSQLRAYLEARDIPFRTDESNADLRIPRNRVRAELIPWIEERFNPGIVDVLADEATLLQAQHAHLTDEANAWFDRWGQSSARQTRLECAPLLAASEAVARAVARQAMTAQSGSRPVSFADVEQLLEVAHGRLPGFDAPGMRVERIGADVVLSGRPEGQRGRWQLPKAEANLFAYPLSIPGEVHIGEAGAAVSAELAVSWAGRIDPGAMAAVQMPGPVQPLTVRNRRPGDRFQPLGCDGRKKLQDFFVDRKVARIGRDRVPLVVDAADRIVWVAGHAIDEAFRVTDPSQSVIILRLKAAGGSV